MDKGLRDTLITGVITILLSVGGGWVLSTKQQAQNTVQIAAVKAEVLDLRRKDEKYSSSVLTIQAKTLEHDRRLKDHERWLENVVVKMQTVEISAEKTTTALDNLTKAVNTLSETNRRFAEVTIRVDERVKKLEKGE